jgi:urease accessory protein
VRFPRPLAERPRRAILINTAGGITGGDVLRTDVEIAGAAHLTTQAAERFYRASRGSPPAIIDTHLRAAPGADVRWLPHETIVFDGSRTNRRLTIHLAPDTRLVACEMLVLGRLASGERLRDVTLTDRITINVDERPVLIDALRLTGDLDSALDRPAVGGGARALASLVLAGSNLEEHRDHLRALFDRSTLGRDGVEAATSICNGLLVARVLACDGALLRAAVFAALPRAWPKTSILGPG